MQVRKQFEEERKARVEVVKLKQEDKRWAAIHGLSGDQGAFQGMIARFRLGMPTTPEKEPEPPTTQLSVYVRSRPLLSEEAKAGGYGVVTTPSAEVGTALVVHEPKTMVDLSKVSSCVIAGLPACLSACVCLRMPACRPACVCLPACLHAYAGLPACLHAYACAPLP